MKKVILLIVLAIMLIPVLLGACSTQSCPTLDNSAPEFSIPGIDGKEVSLKDYQGKSIILNFWQTTCAWCKYQMPFIQNISEKYRSSGLVVLAVNVAEKESDVMTYIQNGNYTLTFLLDKEGKVYSEYCVPGFPATIFINREGIIKSAKLGAFQTESEIEEYLEVLN